MKHTEDHSAYVIVHEVEDNGSTLKIEGKWADTGAEFKAKHIITSDEFLVDEPGSADEMDTLMAVFDEELSERGYPTITEMIADREADDEDDEDL